MYTKAPDTNPPTLSPGQFPSLSAQKNLHRNHFCFLKKINIIRSRESTGAGQEQEVGPTLSMSFMAPSSTQYLLGHQGPHRVHLSACPGVRCSQPISHPRAARVTPFLEMIQCTPVLAVSPRWPQRVGVVRAGHSGQTRRKSLVLFYHKGRNANQVWKMSS